MATVAQDLIKDAFELLGVYATNETMTDADAQRGLSVMNDMLDEWSNLSLVTYEVLEQSGALVVGQQAYTIGTGGNFNLTRPLRILDGPGRAYVQDANGNNYEMNVVDRAFWNQIGNRSSTVITSNFPDTLFYDPQFPLGVINVNPTPNISYTMFWDSMLQLSTYATLTTSFSLPPGYKRAITLNLAVELHPYFSKEPIDPKIPARAAISLGAIKRTNMRPMTAQFDSEIVTKSRGVYNPYIDGYGTGGNRG